MFRSLPASTTASRDPAREVTGILERVISEVPHARTLRAADAGTAAAMAEEIARTTAKKAALLSSSLSLPPGPAGMLTVLPDLYLIWRLQRQMVSDIFGLYGRSAELTRVHMLYCLFRHLASQVARDFVVRTGERLIVQRLSSGALSKALTALGSRLTQRVTGGAASRWVPLVGAAAVGAYAYWDTLQIAKTAGQLLAETASSDATGTGSATPTPGPDSAHG